MSSAAASKDSVINIDAVKAYAIADNAREVWESNDVYEPECTDVWYDEMPIDPSKEADAHSDNGRDPLVAIGPSVTDSNKDEPDSDDEQQPESSDPDEDRVWPRTIDQIVWTMLDFRVTSVLLTKHDRHVYTAIRKDDGQKVVLIVAEDFDLGLTIDGVPREVRLLNSLRGKPQCVQLLGWARPSINGHSSDRFFVLVLDFVHHVNPWIYTRGNISLVAKVFKSMVEAVADLQNTVSHRDIALDNILWDPVAQKAVVIDFDLACFRRERGYYRNVGRESYDSPEKTAVIKAVEKMREKERRLVTSHLSMYGDKAEVFSLGVILWLLINDKDHAPKPYKLKTWVKKAKERGKARKHPEIDLLVKMLDDDPHKRITLLKALEHPFLTTIKLDWQAEQIETLFAKMVQEREDQEDEERSADDDDEKSNDSESSESSKSSKSSKSSDSSKSKDHQPITIEPMIADTAPETLPTTPPPPLPLIKRMD